MYEASKFIEPTVLIVDDEEDILFVLAQGLMAYGYHVRTAATVDAALPLLYGGDVDFVLSDVALPGKDGRWLLEYVMRHHPSLVEEGRFLFVTGDATVVESLARHHGVTVLEKPIGFEHVVAALEAIGHGNATVFPSSRPVVG